MNKRKNRIFIVCLAFLVSASIGYALFRQEKLVTSTTKTGGDFDVSMSCVQGYSSAILTYADMTASDVPSYGYVDDFCNITNNTVSLGTSFKYPGAVIYKTIIIKNNGSIPFVMEVSDDFDYDLYEYQIAGTATVTDTESGTVLSADYKDVSTNNLYKQIYEYFIESGFEHAYIIERKNGTVTSIDDDDEFYYSYVLYDISTDKVYVKINSGESLHIAWYSTWRDKNDSPKTTAVLTETYQFSIQQVTNTMLTMEEAEQYMDW